MTLEFGEFSEVKKEVPLIFGVLGSNLIRRVLGDNNLVQSQNFGERIEFPSENKAYSISVEKRIATLIKGVVVIINLDEP